MAYARLELIPADSDGVFHLENEAGALYGTSSLMVYPRAEAAAPSRDEEPNHLRAVE